MCLSLLRVFSFFRFPSVSRLLLLGLEEPVRRSSIRNNLEDTEYSGLRSGIVESEKIERCSADRSRSPSSRFRGHANDADRLQVRDEIAPSLRSAAVGFREERSERPLRHEENRALESSLVFYVYEVRRDTLETPTPKRGGSVYNGEIRKFGLPTSTKLLHEELAFSPDNDVYIEFLGDRLGKLEPLLGHRSSELKAMAREDLILRQEQVGMPHLWAKMKFQIKTLSG
ncbi:hypothetical protein R1flu_011792 [Riccia fluitans]|uniref:Uncharacterized protein n=1 Tax=Riccia fluitans TaxID=41844 RepID=A0ABD1Z8R9_9MARC